MAIHGPNPPSIADLLRFGQMGLELGYWSQAEGYFDQVLALEPDQREALLGKAAATRDTEQGLALVAQVLARDATDAEALALRDRLLVQLYTVTTSDLQQEPGAKGSADPGGSRKVSEASIPRSRRRARPFWFVLLAAALVVALTLSVVMVINRTWQWVAPWRPQPLAPTPQVASPTEVTPSGAATLERAQRSTVLVLVLDPDSLRISRGSGAVVSADGLVLTNHHVLTDEGSTLLNAQGLALVGLTRDVRQPPDEWYIGALVAHDVLRDLAVLRLVADLSGRSLQQARFDTMSITDSDSLQLGQSLVGLGFPTLGGDTLTLTRGSMAGFATNDSGVQLGKTDSELLPGSSGGAVLDQQGNLVGVITSAHTEERTQGRLSYFVLINEAQEVIKAGQQAPRPAPSVDWLVAASERVVR